MSADPLASALRRAEDIVVQFPHLSPEEATTRVRDHIATFWTPDMRVDLQAAVEQRDAPEQVVAVARALRPQHDGSEVVETVDLTDSDGEGGPDTGPEAADTGEA